MCVSLHPASFTDTIVGTFDGPDGRRYLAYQNTAANLTRPVAPAVVAPTTRSTRSGKASTTTTNRRRGAKSVNWQFEEAITPSASNANTGAGNAMILPIPDAVANIELIDTTTCPNFLKDIRSALTPRTRSTSRGAFLGGADSKSVRIINFDVYTIVIAKNARDLTKAVASDAVPADRRPAINAAIIKAYTKWYPGWAIAVCCFSNTDAKRAKPLLFSYEPTKQDDPDFLFVPTLDCHDGGVPDLTAKVDVDHTIFVGIADFPGDHGLTVFYSDGEIAPGIRELLPRKVNGKVVTGQYRNGDVVFKRSDLKAGIVRGLRALPPGAEQALTKEFI